MSVLARDTKLELLRGIPLFSGCSRRELREIALVADEIVVPDGTALTREGETGMELVVIVDGEATVTRRGRTINTVSGGDFVGEIALVSDTPRTAFTSTSPAW